MDLRSKVLVITGGGNGIGEALCRRFSQESPSHVAVLDLDEQAAGRVAASLDCEARGYGVDVANAKELEACLGSIEAEHHAIDLLFSNAGIFIPGGVEVGDDDWERIWKINVHAHVVAARAVLPGMLERGAGYICSTASAAGLLAQVGSAPYSVTKHAAVATAEWLAITYGDRGIKVSVLCPQAVATNMTAGTEGGGVAGLDGMLSPGEVAEVVMNGVSEEEFLILPHPEVAEYEKRRSGDRGRWLRGMQRLNAVFASQMLE